MSYWWNRKGLPFRSTCVHSQKLVICVVCVVDHRMSCPFFFFSLYCLSLELRLLITVLIPSNCSYWLHVLASYIRINIRLKYLGKVCCCWRVLQAFRFSLLIHWPPWYIWNVAKNNMWHQLPITNCRSGHVLRCMEQNNSYILIILFKYTCNIIGY